MIANVGVCLKSSLVADTKPLSKVIRLGYCQNFTVRNLEDQGKLSTKLRMNSSDIVCMYEDFVNSTNNSTNSSCVNRTIPSFIDIASFMHIFPSIYGILCTVGVIANSLVIYAVATCKKKMVSDIYVLNLAIADLLFLLVMPFNIHQLVRDRQWVFGNFMCKAVVVVDVSNQFTTVGIVTVLCIDR